MKCGRCGGPVELGHVSGGGGLFGFAAWGKLGWVPETVKRWKRRMFGEVLAEVFVGPARAPGYRCTSCRIVWFEY